MKRSTVCRDCGKSWDEVERSKKNTNYCKDCHNAKRRAEALGKKLLENPNYKPKDHSRCKECGKPWDMVEKRGQLLLCIPCFRKIDLVKKRQRYIPRPKTTHCKDCGKSWDEVEKFQGKLCRLCYYEYCKKLYAEKRARENKKYTPHGICEDCGLPAGGKKLLCNMCYDARQLGLPCRQKHYNRDRTRITAEKLRLTDPELLWVRNVYSSMQCRVRKKNLPCNVDRDYLYELAKKTKTCEVLRIPLVYGNRGKQYNSPSIDRTEPAKGYTKDNIVIISDQGNTWKSNMSVKDCEKVLAYLKKIEEA